MGWNEHGTTRGFRRVDLWLTWRCRRYRLAWGIFTFVAVPRRPEVERTDTAA